VSGTIFAEDVEYLDGWSSDILQKAKEWHYVAKEKDARLLFSISVTGHNSGIQEPYHSPLRLLEDSLIFGVVVFSQIQAVIAANTVSSFVDKILVDVEQKIIVQGSVNYKLLEHFRISIDKKVKKSFNHGDIISPIRSIVSNSKVIEYKPNDITVDAVWSLLSTKLPHLSGKKIAILGCGNIGSKIALKLVESGADVVLVRRNKLKGSLIAESINAIKPRGSTSVASYSSSCIEASKLCNVLIGTANANTPIINWSMIQSMFKGGFVIDLGKGNVEIDAIEKSLKNNIDIIRGDITASLYGFISHHRQVEDIVKNKIGRKHINKEISIVSGGLLGKSGEIVVDNFSYPSFIYGVSDGRGSIKTQLNVIDKKNIKILKMLYKL